MTAVGSVVDLAPVDCTDNGIACRRHEKRGRMPRLALPSAGGVKPQQEAPSPALFLRDRDQLVSMVEGLG